MKELFLGFDFVFEQSLTWKGNEPISFIKLQTFETLSIHNVVDEKNKYTMRPN